MADREGRDEAVHGPAAIVQDQVEDLQEQIDIIAQSLLDAADALQGVVAMWKIYRPGEEK